MPTGEWERKPGVEEVVEGAVARNEDPISGLQEQAIDCIQHAAPANLQIHVFGSISTTLLSHQSKQVKI